MSSDFINKLRRDMRLRGYSIRTEESYLFWIKRLIRFNGLRHPRDMGGAEVKVFLSHLANDCFVAPNTQRVALNAFAFLYNKYLNQPLGELDFTLARQNRHIPSVLNASEASRILAQLSGRNCLIVALTYGSGLRVSEVLKTEGHDNNLALVSTCLCFLL